MEIIFNCEEYNTAKIKLLGDPSEDILKFLCGLVPNNNVWFLDIDGTALFDCTLGGRGELTTRKYSIYSLEISQEGVSSQSQTSPKTFTIKIFNGHGLLD